MERRGRHNAGMSRAVRIPLIVLGLCLLLGAAAVVALHQWAAGAGLRERVEREATAALGLPVRLARVAVDAWPLPVVVLEGLEIQAQPALTLARVEVRPVWTALLSGRLEVATLWVREAVLPQATVLLLAAKLKDPSRDAGAPPSAGTDAGTDEPAPGVGRWPRRVVLDGVTWVDARGRGTTVVADLDVEPDGWPGAVDVRITDGAMRGAKALLRREAGQGPALAWTLKLDVGGGTVEGPMSVTPPDAKARELVFEGRLETRGVEVAALTAPSRPLTGRLDASTTLSARIDPGAASAAAVTDALRTQTRFTVHNAVLQGLDLAKAVVSVGLSRGGLTELDTLEGQLGTRGQTLQLSQLVAKSGVLAASGEVTVAPSRALSGRLSVDVTRGASGGVVSVPLAVGGTLDDPSVTLSRSALLGAAIGTAILPGVGTGAGANLGERIGEGLKDLLGK